MTKFFSGFVAPCIFTKKSRQSDFYLDFCLYFTRDFPLVKYRGIKQVPNFCPRIRLLISFKKSSKNMVNSAETGFKSAVDLFVLTRCEFLKCNFEG